MFLSALDVGFIYQSYAKEEELGDLDESTGRRAAGTESYLHGDP